MWTIQQLVQAVESAIAVAGLPGQASARVRAVPDERTIRYYTTLGLLDKPAQMLGRTALYSRRHLLQLIAIKRLQAQGLSLTQIQASLLGAGAATLEQLAALPQHFAPPLAAPAPDVARSQPEAAIAPPENGRPSFWMAVPVQPTSPPPPEPDFAPKVVCEIPLTGRTALIIKGLSAEGWATRWQPALAAVLERLCCELGKLESPPALDRSAPRTAPPTDSCSFPAEKPISHPKEQP